MDEFDLIERFFAARAERRSDVCLGIGDDAAVTRFDPGYELAIATDTLVEGTHFPVGTAARAIGHRCLAVNLSDLAAMGAEPLWCTLALSLPDGSPEWVDEFSAGFMALATEYRIGLVGGDTVRGPLSITVTVHGRVIPDKAVRRSGAGIDQRIYVTGNPGRAATGLALLVGSDATKIEDGASAVERFLYPVPRVAEGCELVGVATAMIDVSDGLHVDLSRLLRASGVGALLSVTALPLADESVRQFGRERAVELALTGGDDYELCFTAPVECDAALQQLAANWACGITCIGDTRAGTDIVWQDQQERYEIADIGYRHFTEDSA